MKRSSTIAKAISLSILWFLVAIQTVSAQTANWKDSVDISWYNDSETEFTITTAKQLAGLIELVVNERHYFEGKTVKLGANIWLNDTTGWANWGTEPPKYSWTPIGATGMRPTSLYNGVFDGNGFVIGGLYMKNNYSYVGLFYMTDAGATIKNLGIIASHIEGSQRVGGLAGENRGKISNSYFIGNVVAGQKFVGGLVGYNQGIINNSYSKCNVTGTEDVGGLVGYNLNNYSVTANNIINSYYDKNASGQTDEGKGIGKTTAQMQSKVFADSLNFAAGLISMSAWVYSDGKYPVISQVAAKADMDGFFEKGKGTEAEPYIIGSKKQLEDFSKLVNSGSDFSGKYLKLGRDIMLNDTIGWQVWEFITPANIWTPIGMLYNNNGNVFNGTFDGGGFVISGVYVNDSNDYKGLFGYLDFGGTIKSLGVVASYIKGNEQLGGLAGSSLGKISNSYFRGIVTGQERYIGGLTGSNCLTVKNLVISIGAISNSYFTGTINGKSYIGGLAGSNAGTINNSYSFGKITGQDIVGGLVGINSADGTISNSYSVSKVVATETLYESSYGGIAANNNNTAISISNSYYNSDSTYNSNNSIGAAKTTAQMKQKATFSGWDFNGTWRIDNKINGSYPHLRWSVPNIDWYDDSETEFIITTAQQLAGFAALVNAGYKFNDKTVKLGKDIALNDTANWQNWATNPPANRWVPIGTLYNSFYGTFDGNGYVISGVYVNDTNNYYQGLFGIVFVTVKNIGVTASYVKGKNYVGGLVGVCVCAMSNNYFAGIVTGKDNVGGLVGNNSGIIISSYSSGTVTGENNVGGFVGNAGIESNVNNNYSLAKVSGQTKVGGLVGNNEGGMIRSSYSAGVITGITFTGGLVGDNPSGMVTNSYYNRQTSGQTDDAGKGSGKTTAQMKLEETYVDWYFDDIWGIDGNINEGYPHLLWSSQRLCEEAGNTYENGVCKTAEQIAKETCEATEGSKYENGVCKTAEQIAKETCEATEGSKYENGVCKTAEQIAQETCEATEGSKYENGVCKTAEQIAQETCEAEGLFWEGGECTTPVRQSQLAYGQVRAQAIGSSIVLENIPSNAKVKVYSIQGKQVYSAVNNSASGRLRISAVARGVYIVNVGTETLRVVVR